MVYKNIKQLQEEVNYYKDKAVKMGYDGSNIKNFLDEEDYFLHLVAHTKRDDLIYFVSELEYLIDRDTSVLDLIKLKKSLEG